jgi:hypothetical protein
MLAMIEPTGESVIAPPFRSLWRGYRANVRRTDYADNARTGDATTRFEIALSY